ncbi:MAG: restriction endonuclease [Acetivibrio sp.]
MSGIAFEEYLKLRFEVLGFKVNTTKVSNDYGADLILQKKKLTIAVQVKRYRSSIGVKAIQEVIGSMAYYEAQKGLVVTNSYYTKNACELAFSNHVILWDRDVLVRLIANENMSEYLSQLLDDSNY